MPAPTTIPPGHRPLVTFHLPVDTRLFCHVVEAAGPDTALTNVNGNDQTIVLSIPGDRPAREPFPAFGAVRGDH